MSMSTGISGRSLNATVTIGPGARPMSRRPADATTSEHREGIGVHFKGNLCILRCPAGDRPDAGRCLADVNPNMVMTSAGDRPIPDRRPSGHRPMLVRESHDEVYIVRSSGDNRADAVGCPFDHRAMPRPVTI